MNPNIKDNIMTSNPHDPLTAHNLKNFAAIAALNGILANEGAPALDHHQFKDIIENDCKRAAEYADKLLEVVSGNQAVAPQLEHESK